MHFAKLFSLLMLLIMLTACLSSEEDEASDENNQSQEISTVGTTLQEGQTNVNHQLMHSIVTRLDQLIQDTDDYILQSGIDGLADADSEQLSVQNLQSELSVLQQRLKKVRYE